MTLEERKEKKDIALNALKRLKWNYNEKDVVLALQNLCAIVFDKEDLDG